MILKMATRDLGSPTDLSQTKATPRLLELVGPGVPGAASPRSKDIETHYSHPMQIAPQTRHYLETARSGHLATADTTADPHLIPVVFVLIDNAIYIVIDDKPKTTTRLKRLRNIEANPRAAFLVDTYDDDWTKLGWVLCRGPADILEQITHAQDTALREDVLAELRAKYPQYHDHQLAQRPIIRLRIERVTSWGQVE